MRQPRAIHVLMTVLALIAGGCPGDTTGDLSGDTSGGGSTGTTTTDPTQQNGETGGGSSEPTTGTTTIIEAAPLAYGDGSAGAKLVDGNLTLADGNLQYTNFTVAAGVTLTIQSGAVIRCSGTFTNNGTIIVKPGADGADRTGAGFDNTTLDGSSPTAASGIATSSAGNGEIGDNTSDRTGGADAGGLSEFEARVTLVIGVNVGGGGGAARAAGGSGGGGLTILAMDGIVNNGSVQADGGDGGDGGGGGGGGAIILASPESITNSAGASLSADGGDSGASGDGEAPGGGGGGGIIHLLAPTVTNDGSTSVAGGSPGALGAPLSIVAPIRSGGGGGGASAGNGGAGGDVDTGATASPTAGQSGSAGFFLTTLADPSALF